MKLKHISLDKLETIRPGDEFSSSKALIEHLGLVYKTGDAGVKQRKCLHHLFDCTQEPGKRKFLIKEVYPLEVIQANFDPFNRGGM